MCWLYFQPGELTTACQTPRVAPDSELGPAGVVGGGTRVMGMVARCGLVGYTMTTLRVHTVAHCTLL